ncbi:MAG TPA: DUF5667 domain-containing protein, partial [Mycobacteriales bacterium]
GVRQPAPGRATRPNRRLALLAGTLSALVVFSGLTVVVSDHALPGDTLYSLKRTTEGVELALARGEQARAERHLDFAQTRARELADLVRRSAPGATSTPTPPVSVTGVDGDSQTSIDRALVDTTLGDMDQQTRDGVRALTEFAVTTVADAPLADLSSWVADQRAILQPVLEGLHGDANLRATRSVALLNRVRDRVVALRSQLTCACMDRGHIDDLGPLPCWPCDPPTAPQPQAGTTPPASQTGGARQGPTKPPPSAPDHTAPPSGSASPTGTPGGTSPQATSPPPDDPSLLPSVSSEPTDGGLLPPILPTGELPPLLPGLLPGLLGG